MMIIPLLVAKIKRQLRGILAIFDCKLMRLSIIKACLMSIVEKQWSRSFSEPWFFDAILLPQSAHFAFGAI